MKDETKDPFHPDNLALTPEDIETINRIRAAHNQVDHPPHYTHGEIEVIAAIEDWKLGFHLGNVVKYVARSAHKGSEITDLLKAKWYLEREIARLESEFERRARP